MTDHEQFVKEIIRSARRYGARRSSGVGRFIAHLKGETLTPVEAISAKCADCMAWYEDPGDPDCYNGDCPLHPHYVELLKLDPISTRAPAKTGGAMPGDQNREADPATAAGTGRAGDSAQSSRNCSHELNRDRHTSGRGAAPPLAPHGAMDRPRHHRTNV